jgi:hypothetical protein
MALNFAVTLELLHEILDEVPEEQVHVSARLRGPVQLTVDERVGNFVVIEQGLNVVGFPAGRLV